MAGDAARTMDSRFPNLRSEVVEGYVNAPVTVVAEIIDGELTLMPRPRPRQARAAGELFAELRGPFDAGRGGPGGWVFLIEPELHLGVKPDIIVPDIAGWKRERYPEDSLDDGAEGHLSIALDWVCEVISPRTKAHDRGKKMRVYRREQVGHLWYVDPGDTSVEVFRLENQRYSLLESYEDNALLRAEPFEGIGIPLTLLWKLRAHEV